MSAEHGIITGLVQDRGQSNGLDVLNLTSIYLSEISKGNNQSQLAAIENISEMARAHGLNLNQIQEAQSHAQAILSWNM